MAEDELRQPTIFCCVHLNWDAAAIVPHRDAVVVGVDVDLHGVHGLNRNGTGFKIRCISMQCLPAAV